MSKSGIGRVLALGVGMSVVCALTSVGCAVEQADDSEQSLANVTTPGGQCVGGPSFDPAGAKNVGNSAGRQFIGGQCLSNNDCASGCCALPCGICSGPGAQFQAGKQGCGFESRAARTRPTPPPPPPTPPPPPAPTAGGGGQCSGGPPFDPAGAKNVGNGVGQQFIGGQCLSNNDCASGCCALPCGICSGPGAQFQAGKQGCGFESGQASARPTPPPPPPPPPAPTAGTGGQCSGGPPFDPAGAKNVGNGVGRQFIGGQCLSSKDCASGCCALPCGICSGPGAQFQAGKQGCGFGD